MSTPAATAAAAGPAAGAQPSDPPGQADACPLCGAPLDPKQSWCLSCGAAARTRLAPAPNWRTPLIVLGVLVVLSVAGLTAALVELTGGSTVTTVTSGATPPPAVAPAIGATPSGATPPATAAPATGASGATGAAAAPATGASGARGAAATRATGATALTGAVQAPTGSSGATGAAGSRPARR